MSKCGIVEFGGLKIDSRVNLHEMDDEDPTWKTRI
jgi:hypothetical protein